jgi:hypothetical protein
MIFRDVRFAPHRSGFSREPQNSRLKPVLRAVEGTLLRDEDVIVLLIYFSIAATSLVRSSLILSASSLLL